MAQLNTCMVHRDIVVVWQGYDQCPLCEAEKEINSLENKVADLEEEIEDLAEDNKN